MIRIVILWLTGVIIIVPYCIYRLLYIAEPDEYAFLIVFPLFWIFGFWGVVGPMVGAFKVHKLIKAIEKAGSYSEVEKAYEENEGKEIVIDLIANENKIPRFMARWLYKKVEPRLREKVKKASANRESSKFNK